MFCVSSSWCHVFFLHCVIVELPGRSYLLFESGTQPKKSLMITFLIFIPQNTKINNIVYGYFMVKIQCQYVKTKLQQDNYEIICIICECSVREFWSIQNFFTADICSLNYSKDFHKMILFVLFS